MSLSGDELPFPGSKCGLITQFEMTVSIISICLASLNQNAVAKNEKLSRYVYAAKHPNIRQCGLILGHFH